MQRRLPRFRGLRWKLTWSYTWVTVAALLVVEGLGLAAALFFIQSTPLLPRLASQVLVQNAPQAYPYLAGPSPDLEGLNVWLQNAAVNGFDYQDESGSRASLDPTSLAEAGDARLLVLDPAGSLLAAVPPFPDTGPGEPLLASLPAPLQELTARSLAGEEDPDELFQLTGDRKLYITAPIRQAPGEPVVGVLAFTGSTLPAQSPFSGLASVLGVSLVLFTLTAGGIGTLFGFFTARGLARRLKTVSQAADSWSRGDFSVFIRDRSDDEIGQLATRLNRMAEQLQNLLQTREDLAAVEERNRLARDLHDSVKQQIFAASMQVGAARALLEKDPRAADQRLVEAESLTRQAQDELSTLIRQLRPVALADKGLAEALPEMAETWGERNNIQVEVRLQGARSMPLHIEQALYRVAQEALANIARHSQAGRVDLHLAWEPESVSLTIEDDGRGFDPQAADGRGVGLRSMAERIEALGGRLHLTSAPGHGVRIQADIPLPANRTSG